MFCNNELITMCALYLNDYTYIARDKCGKLWGYQGYPKQLETMYDYGNGDYIVSLNDDFFQQIQWGNVLDVELELSKIE